MVGEPRVPEPDLLIELPGGRRLAADDLGDPDGVPVLHLHGAPDCRLARHPDDGVAARLGVRLVAVDRPGYAWSDPQPAPDVAGWASDVTVLLDHLGIDRCRVAAWSAGAPWGLGLAAALPARVESVVTYGAVAPYEAFADPAVVAASGPRAGMVEELAAGASAAEVAAAMAALLAPPPPVDFELARELVTEGADPAALAETTSVPGLVDQLARSLASAVARHGGAGLAADLTVQLSAGSLALVEAVRCPVVLVHGRHDPIAGPAVGEWLAARLPDAAVATWDRGHRGLLADWERWLELAARDPS